MNDLRHSFHITLHARPPGTWPRQSMVLDGIDTATLDIPPSRLDCLLPVSFEMAFSLLLALPRLFIEPDGSFVWVSARNVARPWQVDGMLYDRGGRLLYVELKGNCPGSAFAELLTACGFPIVPFVVQLVRHAVVLEIADFRRVRLED